MITREFGSSWAAACEGAPPPLHAVADHGQAQWYPLERPVLRAQPAGPHFVHSAPGPPVGDDPTDLAQQTSRRIPTFGMIGRAEVTGRPAQLAAAGNIGIGGVRL